MTRKFTMKFLDAMDEGWIDPQNSLRTCSVTCPSARWKTSLGLRGTSITRKTKTRSDPCVVTVLW